MNIKITGTGSYIPNVVVKNTDFNQHQFLNEDGSAFKQANDIIIKKFKAITGIEERRYALPELNTSDLGFFAAEKAIANAQINPEELDYIIVASNYGDVKYGQHQCDTVPSMGSRIKHKLGIQNPNCVAYDLLFGCPGWVQAMIHAQGFMRAGMAKKCLVIGAETLSRVVDTSDRDSMIYSDGAGATILEISENEKGILSHEAASYTFNESAYINFGESYNQEDETQTRFIKMKGRKIYEFALTNVPLAMKKCLDKSGVNITDLKKIFIHQANEKMDEAIIERFYKLYNLEAPENIMPMCINEFGNSSVATIPTLYDIVLKENFKGHSLNTGDVVLFASVGAGMNINAFVYQY